MPNLEEFLFWLVLAIYVPALLVHFTLGRNGGHRLFEKDGLTPEEVRALPFQMLSRKLERQGRSAFAVLMGMAVALVVYPLGCLIGLPLNALGLSNQTLFYLIVGGVVVALTLLRRG